MVAQDASRVIKRIVEVLSGVQSPKFAQEKALCLFQLKAWLLENRPEDLDVLNDAKTVFASLSVTVQVLSQVRQAKQAGKILLASDVIRGWNNVERLDMLDKCFDHPKGFFGLTSKPSLEALGVRAERDVRKTQSVNKYTEYCIRVHMAGETAVKDKARKLYMLAAETNKILLKEIDPILAERRRRLAFLYVATEIDRPVLNFVEGRTEFWKLLNEQTAKKYEKRFVAFFSHVAFVQSVMAHGHHVTGEQIAEWADCDKVRPPGIVAIEADEMKRAQDYHDTSIK